MKNKKLISLITALSMLFCMSVTAGAQSVPLGVFLKQVAEQIIEKNEDKLPVKPDLSQLDQLVSVLGTLGLPQTIDVPESFDISGIRSLDIPMNFDLSVFESWDVPSVIPSSWELPFSLTDPSVFPFPIPATWDIPSIGTASDDTPVRPGDVDLDGTITSNDALMILRMSLIDEIKDLSLFSFYDANGNGVVDSADALMVLRISIGYEK